MDEKDNVYRCLGSGSNGEGSSSGSSSGDDSRCGDSLLNGKYLWNGGCENGSVDPVDPATCSIRYRISSYRDDREVISFLTLHYSGSTIEELGTLVGTFSFSDLTSYSPEGCQHGDGVDSRLRQVYSEAQCLLESSSELRFFKDGEGKVCIHKEQMFFVTNQPFRRDSCENKRDPLWNICVDPLAPLPDYDCRTDSDCSSGKVCALDKENNVYRCVSRALAENWEN